MNNIKNVIRFMNNNKNKLNSSTNKLKRKKKITF